MFLPHSLGFAGANLSAAPDAVPASRTPHVAAVYFLVAPRAFNGITTLGCTFSFLFLHAFFSFLGEKACDSPMVGGNMLLPRHMGSLLPFHCRLVCPQADIPLRKARTGSERKSSNMFSKNVDSILWEKNESVQLRGMQNEVAKCTLFLISRQCGWIVKNRRAAQDAGFSYRGTQVFFRPRKIKGMQSARK